MTSTFRGEAEGENWKLMEERDKKKGEHRRHKCWRE